MLNQDINTGAPIHRGSQNNAPMPQQPLANDTSTNQVNPIPRSYASAIMSPSVQSFPKREQAIVLDVVDGIKISDYIIAVGSIVGPKNVKFASRISNNRVCIYLSSKNLVDTLIQTTSEVIIEGNKINIRRLISPAKRIIMSNVCPTIPHHLIENELKIIGLELVSPTSFLKVGIIDEQYSHVFSFRRQIYVSPPEESFELPSSLAINYEDTIYRIFLSFDQITCFLCKREGHIAKNCPSSEASNPKTQNDTVDTVDFTDDVEIAEKVHPNHTDSENESTEEIQPTPQPTVEQQISLKRNAPSLSSLSTLENQSQASNSADETHTQTNPKKTKIPEFNKTKKLKKSDSLESLTPIDEQLNPVRDMLDQNPENYILDFRQLVDFLENAHGSKNPLKVADRYTKDTEELLIMLDNIYPALNHHSIKCRITRLRNQIRKQMIALNTNSPPSNHKPSSYPANTQ